MSKHLIAAAPQAGQRFNDRPVSALGGHLKTGQSGSPENRPVVDQHPGQ